MAHVFVPADALKPVGVWTHRDPPEFDTALRESRLLRWSV
jgi:hypothetical protein